MAENDGSGFPSGCQGKSWILNASSIPRYRPNSIFRGGQLDRVFACLSMLPPGLAAMRRVVILLFRPA
ncbi:MAG: hypothetical protein DLM58_00710 [Pseudonocardiales bacterium]|nr:MAG: hypothetical protein DLM58_00710 [Pseudonocardiales bacterium]